MESQVIMTIMYEGHVHVAKACLAKQGCALVLVENLAREPFPIRVRPFVNAPHIGETLNGGTGFTLVGATTYLSPQG